MHISEWIADGCPEGVWFHIIRQHPLEHATRETHIALASLILLVLESYGNFETSQLQRVVFFDDDYYGFQHSGHEFIVEATAGTINSETVPVVAVSINAKIIKTLVDPDKEETV